jgi:hypothetical protein
MISKSKIGTIAFVAAISLPLVAVGLASPAFAIDSNSPALTGGGSYGHNQLEQSFRAKHHPKQHTQHHQAPQ